MHEIFAREGIDEWQDLYTKEEVETCFNEHVTVLNYSELHKYDNLITISALSSGYHIGSTNWLLEVGTSIKIGLLRNSSEVEEYSRYPLALNADPLRNLDVLIVGKIMRNSL